MTSKEPTRPIGEPTPASDGTLRAKTTLSPTACRVRARLDVPPSKVMPIIVVPGIMGTNLRASTKQGTERNRILKPGEVAWRPPNGAREGMSEAKKWEGTSTAARQAMLTGTTLEVDPNGNINLPPPVTISGMNTDLARDYGWGEIHWSSYGKLLISLRRQFTNFLTCTWDNAGLSSEWQGLNMFDRKRWGSYQDSFLEKFTISEVEKLGEYWYPVYAFGYNWLQSNEESAKHLQQLIERIIGNWSTPELDCRQVMLVTHSMGGLVARACAKAIPEKIRGVVHACMPALGAPVCYRRIACGTEASTPGNNVIENTAAEKFSIIAGRTPAETNSVMAYASGVLELLPNNLYSKPWLFMSSKADASRVQDLQNPENDIYEVYRNTTVWYKVFQRELLDPAKLYDNPEQAMSDTIKKAKKFHDSILCDYYHSNTFTVFGADKKNFSYGCFSWLSPVSVRIALADMKNGKLVGTFPSGARSVEFKNSQPIKFDPSVQDTEGDGTVPEQSAAACKKIVKAAFSLSGFSHQDVFDSDPARALMLQLTARAILEP